MPFHHCHLHVWLIRIFLVAGCVLPPSVVLGQGQSGTLVPVRGEVQNVPLGEELSVEFSILGFGTPPIQAEVTRTGQFMVEGLRRGSYQVRVVGPYRNVIYRTFVEVNGEEELSITLPKIKSEAPPLGKVSVGELRQEIAPKARKEFDRAVAGYEKGSTEKAIAHLKKALEADPSFADAHNELGACYSKLGQQDKAAAEFAKASGLDPDSGIMQLNLGLSLLKLERFPEAEDAARAALRLDPESAEAHFVLGYSLYAQKRLGPEVVDNLVWAGRQLPEALLIAADVLLREGRGSEATGELRQYLASPEPGPDRQRAQALLKQLGK